MRISRLDWMDWVGVAIITVCLLAGGRGLYLAGERHVAERTRSLPALLGGVLHQHGGRAVISIPALEWMEEAERAGVVIRWAPQEDGSLLVWTVEPEEPR